jgi:predicted NBD/HSP70 family sugar kinase
MREGKIGTPGEGIEMDTLHSIYDDQLRVIRRLSNASPYLIGRVLRCIFMAGGPLARIDVEKERMLRPYRPALGGQLSAGTVKGVTDALLADNVQLLIRADPRELRNRPGRPVVPLRLGGSRWGLIGVHVSHSRDHVSNLTGVVCGVDGEPVSGPHSFDVRPGETRPDPQAAVAEKVADICAKLLADCPEREILGIGVAMPGHVHKGHIKSSALSGWGEQEISLATAIRNRLSLPQRVSPVISVENDTKVLAIQSLYERSLSSPYACLVQVYPENVGGALVVNGRLYTGGNGIAPELGHLTTDFRPSRPAVPHKRGLRRFEDRCDCHQYGHVNTRATPRRILDEIEDRLLEQHGQHPIAAVDHRLPSALAAAAAVSECKYESDSSDRILTTHALVFREAGEALGRGLAQLANVLNPDQLIVRLPAALARPHPQSSGSHYVAGLEAAFTRYAFSTAASDARSGRDRLDIQALDLDSLSLLTAKAAAVSMLYHFVEHIQGFDECSSLGKMEQGHVYVDRAAGE